LAISSTEETREGGAAVPGGAPTVARSWPIASLASVRLTLWLLAILMIAMAVATLIPQNAPTQGYLKVLGTLLGGVVAKSTLRNIYGSWWFAGAFALLAVNLLACSWQRAAHLLRPARKTPIRVTRGQVTWGRHARWRLSQSVETAAGDLSAALRRAGYTVVEAPGEESGQRGLVARRGQLAAWAPVIVHVGMVVILLGAAWGRLPRNAYRAFPMLRPGETFTVKAGGEAFGLRLADGGTAHDAEGRPTDYWAKLEVLEEDTVVRRQMVRPNHPLRYHAISAVLQSITPAGYGVEVTKGGAVSTVPVVFAQEGTVDMMATLRHLEDPPWIVFIHDFREHGGGGSSPEARVFIDRSGKLSPNWEAVGWVGAEGVDSSGVHFQLVQAGSRVQVNLDRDIGLPIVYLGFLTIAMGSVLTLGAPRRSLTALVSAKGKGSTAFIGASRLSPREAEKLLGQLASELGATQEAGTQPKDEEES